MHVDVDELTASLEKHLLTWRGTEYEGKILSFPQVAPFLSDFTALMEYGEDSEDSEVAEAFDKAVDTIESFLDRLSFTSDEDEELDVEEFMEATPSPVLLEVVMDFFEAQMDALEQVAPDEE